MGGRRSVVWPFVFPKPAYGAFLPEISLEVADTPFSPTILTINDLFIQLSGKQSADRISMLLPCTTSTSAKAVPPRLSMNSCIRGEMLLNDFDDIDKYMAMPACYSVT